MGGQQTTTTQVSLGPGGPLISPLGIGTWAWGDRLFWGYGRGYADEDIQGAFRASLEAGINFFDTAEVYGFGRSEKFLGQFAAGAEQNPVIATKFFPYPWRLTKDSLLRAARGSVKRLRVRQIDLYQLHWPTPPVSVETWMSAMADAVEAGLVRLVGVSNCNVELTRRAHAALAARGIPLASNQIEYNLLHRQPERNGLIETCRELGVTVIAYSPLAMGVLTGKYTPDNPPSGYRGMQYKRELLARVQPLIALLREIGEKHGGKTPAQVAINWVICKGAVPIPGAKNARQARDNAGAMGWRLTDDEVAVLDSASEGF